jgi:hypothetical protein
MPQKKTRIAKSNHKTKTKTRTKLSHFRKVFDRTPTPYPFSQISPTDQTIGTITSSSSVMNAMSRDGKHWHVDTDVNGVKKHTNLTNSQIMDILSYPAAKQNLKTRLLQEFRNIPQPQPQPQLISPNFGLPIIRMVGSMEEPKIEYIYKKGCSSSNNPIMLNNLSPLHEAKIVPESSGEMIHLVPIYSSSSSSSSSNKRNVPSKGSIKGKTKSKKQNRKR